VVDAQCSDASIHMRRDDDFRTTQDLLAIRGAPHQINLFHLVQPAGCRLFPAKLGSDPVSMWNMSPRPVPPPAALGLERNPRRQEFSEVQAKDCVQLR